MVNPEHLCYFHSNLDMSHEKDEENKMVGRLTLAQRKEKIKRYKEKKKNRLTNRKIRYTIRKANAQKKLRIKGRFVSEQTKNVDRNEQYKWEIPIIDKPMFSIRRIKCKLCPLSHLLYHSSCKC